MKMDKIDFHNVEEIIKTENGYRLSRLPQTTANRLDEGTADVSCSGTGVELRFKIKGDAAVLRLRADKGAEVRAAYIYYGAFQGGWENSSRIILSEETAVRIERPKNLEIMKRVTAERKLGFDPEVVRLVLPSGICYYLGAEGEIEAPSAADYPDKTYLAYGSSITHGSLALAMPYSYPFQIAQRFGCDYINLGHAGRARAEKPIAEYIAARPDWDFASVELGINMLGFSEEDFERRVRDFLAVLAEDGRPVFVTSIFGFLGGDQEKAAKFRRIVRDCSGGNLIFTDGLELLDDPAKISEDLVHPSLEGIRQIADRWYEIMRKHLNTII
ncbi:MAG TPA: SGNH/GDSL hydrolase family protein [Candidatus Eisenbergiella merdipullorum]|uniref:SGNH/GDSL hydrolase family protein n=1 Tax=Candidatus Eisenbergiella merdipullorum TaxID=2838553 RepID=A0A9D2KZU9_9FIRM|nr:SGNH/GDSL hydrolase family protein [Candidatus Eisenbergiella merdipullorum]